MKKAAYQLPIVAVALFMAVPAQALPDALREKAKQSKTVKELAGLFGAEGSEPGRRVLVEAPDIVDRNSKVRVRVTSHVAGTDWIIVMADRNLTPFVADEEFSPGQERSMTATVELSQTSKIRVWVRASGKFYQVVREVKVAGPDCEQP